MLYGVTLSQFKTILIILVLTIFFLVDEVIFIVLVKEFEIWNIRFLVLGLVTVVVVALNVLLAMTVYRAMKKKPTTGKEGMIGERGVVISTIDNEGKVFVHGEIWQAESGEILHKGEKVIVLDVEGMKLRVGRSIITPQHKEKRVAGSNPVAPTNI